MSGGRLKPASNKARSSQPGAAIDFMYSRSSLKSCQRGSGEIRPVVKPRALPGPASMEIERIGSTMSRRRVTPIIGAGNSLSASATTS